MVDLVPSFVKDSLMYNGDLSAKFFGEYEEGELRDLTLKLD